MGKRAGFHVLVATDGSTQARAAVAAATAFPWPRGARLHAVVADGDRAGTQGTAEWPASVWAALDRTVERLALDTRRALARRWPKAEVAVLDQPPVDGILSRARKLGARVIVVGSRGYGVLSRLVLGSVSRGVVRRAACPVLVVKGRRRKVRRLVVGLDGSANARRAVGLVASLRPPAGARVTLLSVVEPVRVPSLGLLPASIREALAGQAAALTEERLRAARRVGDSTVQRLKRAGWSARTVVKVGAPVPELLKGLATAGADLLVVGARGVGGVDRLLLGSVAEGALSRSPVSVLIVK